jgi:hypothetical protein
LWSAQRSWSAPGSSLGGAELPLAASWRSRSWPSSRPRRGKLLHPKSSGSPRLAGAWPAGGGRRRAPRRESCDEPDRPARPVTQLAHGGPGPAGRFPPLFHFPACTSGVLAAIFTQRAHNARGSGRSSSMPPTAETGVFSRGCPKLTSSARSSRDQAPDRWDRGERIEQRGRRGALANPGGWSATE